MPRKPPPDIPTIPPHVLDPAVTPSRRDLETAWSATFGRELSPKMRRPLAALLLRFHAQETAYGGLPREVEAFLATLLPKSRTRAVSGAPVAPVPRSLKPGTRLVRVWRDTTYIVTIADPGYLYEGRSYRSLSVIAREITGTPWSGPAFFGLKKAQPAKSA
jgi:hypothetical protein